jgi:hypothetical protein
MQIKIKKSRRADWKNLLSFEYRVGINSSLVEQRGLDQVDIGILFNLHGQKLFLFNDARNFLIKKAKAKKIDLKDIEKIKDYNERLRELEFAAQEAWGFSQNTKYHNWWLDMPGCTCPKLDNLDCSGVDQNIISHECPWHSLPYLENLEKIRKF